MENDQKDYVIHYNGEKVIVHRSENGKFQTPNFVRDLKNVSGGYSPKPAIEVVIVAMKPIEHATYVAQALDNGHGATNLDAGRIPYESEDDTYKERPIGKTRNLFPDLIMRSGNKTSSNTKGRFAPHLLVEDDVFSCVQDKGTKPHPVISNVEGYEGWGSITQKNGEAIHYGDSGSFSRYFSLDAWWDARITERCCVCGYTEEHGNYMDKHGRYFCDECLIAGECLDARIKELPEEVQKTFPFLIVPKENKANKNKGLEGFEKKHVERIQQLPDGFVSSYGNVRNTPAPQSNYHPTVKSIKLISYLITIASREGDTILDPYVGSGTTLVAAEMLNRNAIGIELNKEYCEIAYSRLREVTAQTQIGTPQSTIQKVGFWTYTLKQFRK